MENKTIVICIEALIVVGTVLLIGMYSDDGG